MRSVDVSCGRRLATEFLPSRVLVERRPSLKSLRRRLDPGSVWNAASFSLFGIGVGASAIGVLLIADASRPLTVLCGAAMLLGGLLMSVWVFGWYLISLRRAAGPHR